MDLLDRLGLPARIAPYPALLELRDPLELPDLPERPDPLVLLEQPRPYRGRLDRLERMRRRTQPSTRRPELPTRWLRGITARFSR